MRILYSDCSAAARPNCGPAPAEASAGPPKAKSAARRILSVVFKIAPSVPSLPAIV